MMLSTTITSASLCPYCGKLCDCASRPMEDGNYIAPQEGDVTLCGACGELSVFGPNMILKRPTQEQLDQMPTEVWMEVSRFKRALARVHRENPGIFQREEAEKPLPDLDLYSARQRLLRNALNNRGWALLAWLSHAEQQRKHSQYDFSLLRPQGQGLFPHQRHYVRNLPHFNMMNVVQCAGKGIVAFGHYSREVPK